MPRLADLYVVLSRSCSTAPASTCSRFLLVTSTSRGVQRPRREIPTKGRRTRPTSSRRSGRCHCEPKRRKANADEATT
jgi:hypothetical protein